MSRNIILLLLSALLCSYIDPSLGASNIATSSTKRSLISSIHRWNWRGGASAVEKKSSKKPVLPAKKNLSLIFMIKSFFASMVDPTYVDGINNDKSSKSKTASTASSKFKSDKPPKKVGGAFVSGGGGGASGGVCGPNGCH
eukprot:gene10058-20957_t